MEGIRLQEACNLLQRSEGADLISAYEMWFSVADTLDAALDGCKERYEKTIITVSEKKAAEAQAVEDEKTRKRDEAQKAAELAAAPAEAIQIPEGITVGQAVEAGSIQAAMAAAEKNYVNALAAADEKYQALVAEMAAMKRSTPS